MTIFSLFQLMILYSCKKNKEADNIHGSFPIEEYSYNEIEGICLNFNF